MAKSGKPKPRSPLPANTFGHDVISWYTDLDLPVCDDGKAIQAAFDKKKNRWLRDLNGTDPDKRIAARAWFAHSDHLMKHRDDCRELVYEFFADLCDVAKEANISGGQTTATPEFISALANIARDRCKCDNDLTHRFVNRFLKEKGISTKAGGSLVADPGTVNDFNAKGKLGAIVLSWDLPAKDWDRIEILRKQESGKSSAKPKSVYTGTGTSFQDVDGLVPGKWYRYEARAVFHKSKGQITIARAPCMGEVTQTKPEIKNGEVCLSWTPPSPDLSVHIFRRPNTKPTVSRGTKGIAAGDSDTRSVYVGGGTTWKDPDVKVGVEYHYLIVAEFAQDLYSNGRAIHITVPKPPPDVRRVKAVYVQNAGNNEVKVDWDPVSSGEKVAYVLVRAEGKTPPASPAGGKRVQELNQCSAVDKAVVPGVRYSYAVFAHHGDLYSLRGAESAPVDITADVLSLTPDAGDGVVGLKWKEPQNVNRVVIRRRVSGPPKDHTDGEFIKVIGPGHAQDDNLRNGSMYHYLVCCVYKPDGKYDVFSKGIAVSAMPDRLPEMVHDFKVEPHGQEVVCTWIPPDYGRVIVLRSGQAVQMVPGQRFDQNRLKGLGTPVTTGQNQVVDPRPRVDKPYYSIFTVAGSHAIFGGCLVCAIVPDVSRVKIHRIQSGAKLTWDWPKGCTSVIVARRSGTWAEAVDDPQATLIPFTHVQYQDAGEKFEDRISVKKRARVYYTVYAQVNGPEGQLSARGLTDDCKKFVDLGPWMILTYNVGRPTRGRNNGNQLNLAWTIENPTADFAGFQLLAAQTSVPSSPDDDVVLYKWKPGSKMSDEVDVSLDEIRRLRWSNFFCKLVVTDPLQRPSTLVIHPNTCVKIDDKGRLMTPRTSPLDRVYREGTPMKVICPFCFTEFPIVEMDFSSQYNNERVKAQYGMIDKMKLKRGKGRLKVPKDPSGYPCTRKLCPDQDVEHDLPFNAGLQESLVLGLIGAPNSGKTHYVASLVDRLMGRVGTDLQGALLPVTDGTSDRYQKEFYKPLFEDHRTLLATQGIPEPLIYDLSFDWGQGRKRAVNLALYDTAGENTIDKARAREMLNYLNVASGVIFIIDPLQIRQIRERLPDSILPPPLAVGTPISIIGNILMLLQNGKALQVNEPFSVPVAVVLSKCDVLQEAGLIESNRIWNMEDRRHIGRFDHLYHDDMAGMMGEYMQQWDVQAYNVVTQRFPRHAFFGVSATGCAATGATMNKKYKYIAPWRVEDPLLWLLSQVDVLRRPVG